MANKKNDLFSKLRRGFYDDASFITDGGGELVLNSFTGCDINSFIVMPEPENKEQILDQMGLDPSDYPYPAVKQFAEIETISISSARSVFPVRRLGEDHVHRYTRGGRSIAGTMVFTTFSRDVFAEFYRVHGQDKFFGRNASPPFFVDQIPPFHIMLSAANEYGMVANAALINVTLSNWGTTMSVHDLKIESTYCVDETTEALTDSGWKKYWEIGPFDRLLTINPTTKQIEWQFPEGIHPFQYDGEMIHWKNYRGVDFLTTPNHRWLRTSAYRWAWSGIDAKFEFRETQEIQSSADTILVGGGRPACFSTTPKYSDELVELIGWAVTEGTLIRSKNGAKPYGITIAQSESANPEKVARIRRLVDHFKVGGSTATEVKSNRKVDPSQLDFYLGRGVGQEMVGLLRDKVFEPAFLCDLTHVQAELLYRTMMDGDGHITENGTEIFIQNRGQLTGMFQMLCAMLGKRSSTKYDVDPSNPKITRTTAYRNDVISGSGVNAERVSYKGVVWCPKTPNGTWMARRNENTFWTGNTYVAQFFFPFVQDFNMFMEKVKVAQGSQDSALSEQLIQRSTGYGGRTRLRRPDFILEPDTELYRRYANDWLQKTGTLPGRIA